MQMVCIWCHDTVDMPRQFDGKDPVRCACKAYLTMVACSEKDNGEVLARDRALRRIAEDMDCTVADLQTEKIFGGDTLYLEDEHPRQIRFLWVRRGPRYPAKQRVAS